MPSATATPEDKQNLTTIRFTNVTEAAGVSYEHTPVEPRAEKIEPGWMAGGAVAEDFNGDGWIDLFALRGGNGPSLLYINQRDGTFVDESERRGASMPTIEGKAAAAADYDNDGDIDIVVANDFAPHYLLVNDGIGNFSVDESMLKGPNMFVTSPSWGDIDNDGLLELVLGEWNPLHGVRHLLTSGGDPSSDRGPYPPLWIYRNLGNGELKGYEFHITPFTDLSVFAPRFADFNGDRLADLAVVADHQRSQLYLNAGDGMLTNVTSTNGTGADKNGMGSAIGDYDNDGDLDWFVSSIFSEGDETKGQGEAIGNRLYRNTGDGSFEDVTEIAGVADGNWGWGASFGDLDNDGDLDLFHVNGWVDSSGDMPEKFNDQPARLFENLGDGTFRDIAVAAEADDRGQGRGVILFDYDNDGDLDIFITNNQELIMEGSTETRNPGSPTLLRNDTDNGNHWLKVTLDGEPPLHRNGIGSRVYITIDDQTQMRELHASTNFAAQEPGRIAHFGLGRATKVDEIRAQWVNGDTTIVRDVPSDQHISLPSPSATLSARSAIVNETITATAASDETQGMIYEWIVGGQSFDDPVAISFDNPGVKELQLNIYTKDGHTLIRTEVLSLTVSTPDESDGS